MREKIGDIPPWSPHIIGWGVLGLPVSRRAPCSPKTLTPDVSRARDTPGPMTDHAALKQPGRQTHWSTWCPPAPDPRYSCDGNENGKDRSYSNYLSSCPPPYGGEQGRKGKGCPNPAKGQSAVPLPPHGGAAVSIGGIETITVQCLSVHGCDPTVLRSEGLCEALERFHCSLYPPTPQPSFRTHRGPFRNEMRV